MNETSSQAGIEPTPVFRKLLALLDAGGARYRVIEHPAAGKSEEVARLRGTEVGQGAKAMACKLQIPGGPALHVLADTELFERYREIAFNAGRLDASMVLDADDYLRLARPRRLTIRQAQI